MQVGHSLRDGFDGAIPTAARSGLPTPSMSKKKPGGSSFQPVNTLNREHGNGIAKAATPRLVTQDTSRYFERGRRDATFEGPPAAKRRRISQDTEELFINSSLHRLEAMMKPTSTPARTTATKIQDSILRSNVDDAHEPRRVVVVELEDSRPSNARNRKPFKTPVKDQQPRPQPVQAEAAKVKVSTKLADLFIRADDDPGSPTGAPERVAPERKVLASTTLKNNPSAQKLAPEGFSLKLSSYTTSKQSHDDHDKPTEVQHVRGQGTFYVMAGEKVLEVFQTENFTELFSDENLTTGSGGLVLLRGPKKGADDSTLFLQFASSKEASMFRGLMVRAEGETIKVRIETE
ncbi:hypothetical protein MRB53_041826 [Persea americana]|nr:hypothetical protein MRB53_041826 [Persea americana]